MVSKIVIYEDNVPLRESVVKLIEISDDFEIIGAFGDCNNVEKQVRDLKPEVILMDIELPGINGIEAVDKIRKFNQKVQIIMLTVFDDNNNIFNALSAGANGYLLKKNISDKLLNSVSEVLKGGAPMSPSIARKIIRNMRGKPRIEPPNYELTAREQEILESLTSGNSFKLIADDLHISIDTVRTHVKHIYDKLHVRSQIEAVSKAFREKLV